MPLNPPPPFLTGGSEGTTCGVEDEDALEEDLDEDDEDDLTGASLFQVLEGALGDA